MSDSYVECLVKAKQPAWAKILKVLLVTLTVLSCLVMFVFIISCRSLLSQVWEHIS